jgi:hypothetical protein
MEKCHEAYAEWLKSLVDGAEPFALSVLVAVGFVKIVTNRASTRIQPPAVSLAISEGCTWVTRDGDFGRFDSHGLRWKHLLLE